VIYFESKDGTKFYSISDTQLDLFDRHSVCIRYGKKGYPGHSFYRYFEDKKSLEKYCNRLMDLRFKHGYYTIKKELPDYED
jgi:predicted DNA-binding WGR domain protein